MKKLTILALTVFIWQACSETTNEPIETPLVLGEMVLVPSGNFDMGCTSEQTDCANGENPVHNVTLDAYYIGKYEVSQSEWESVMGTNPSRFIDCGGNCPVERISWYEILVFCNRLSLQEGLTPVYTISDSTHPDDWGVPDTLDGRHDEVWDAAVADFSANGYRLPTEAEWEYAARGGANSEGFKYTGTSDDLNIHLYANFCDVNCPDNWSDDNHDDAYQYTAPVGTYLPNELGLYDMSGNVAEICWDWLGLDYYANSPNINPTGPSTGNGVRVIRGGSWDSHKSMLRVAARMRFVTSVRSVTEGFRLARTP